MIEARTLAALKQIIAENHKVVIDFWSPTCGPCKAFAPVFEKVSNEVDDTVFVKMNIAEDGDVIKVFGLRAVPTLLGFKDGVKTTDRTGMLNEQTFFTFVQDI
jgi:thioredoxin 1